MKYLILAGGNGTRLWPLSRNSYPKQFLTLIGEKSMLQNTALRVSNNPADIYVVTNEATSHIIFRQLKEIYPNFDKSHIILEPIGRNTAPAIAYGCSKFSENDVVAVLSADAYIAKEDAFVDILNQAGQISLSNYIVTLGITPTEPATGYGYIKRNSTQVGNGFEVDKFVEKPNFETAKKYLAEGTYFWNAGIFVFQVKTFYEELAKYAKSIYETTLNINKLQNVSLSDYEKYENISIDYAVMEHSDKIAVIEANIGWNDIGSFKSLYEVLPKNQENNVCKGNPNKILTINSKNNYIYSNKQIVTLGIENLVIANTDDALLISNMECSEQIKTATNILKEQNPDVINKFTTRYKSYGTCKILQEMKNHKVIELTIEPEHSVETHYHKWSTNNITVVKGQAEITIDDKCFVVNETESIHIKKNEVHTIINKSKTEKLIIIEIIIGQSDSADMFYIQK